MVDSYTKLLLHMNGADASPVFTDTSPNQYAVTRAGAAQIDTAQSVFGGASGLFAPATSDCVWLADSDDWNFGTGDFTIDFWVRFNALPADGFGNRFVIVSQVQDVNNDWDFALRNIGGTYYWRFAIYSGGATIFSFSKATTVLVNTWYHVALARSVASWYVFQAGTQCGTTATYADAFPDFAATVQIGAKNTMLCINGWLDELRISKGVARWTSDFTPPIEEYVDLATYFDELMVLTSGGITLNDIPLNYTYKVYDGTTLIATSAAAASSGATTVDVMGYLDLAPFDEIIVLDTSGGIAARHTRPSAIYPGDEYDWVAA